MKKLPVLLLFMPLFFSTCAIEAVETPGDNDPDTTTVYVDESEARLPQSVRSNEGDNNSMDAKAIDVDNDGDLDLVIAIEFTGNKILINDGNGNFTDESESRIPFREYDSEDIAIADFNTDGWVDLFIVSEDNLTNEYYLNDGNGYFTDVSERIPVTRTSNAVVTTDLNNDGLPDILIGNNGQNVILMNTGPGYFSNQTGSRLPQFNDITQDLELADIDNDGDLDLVAGNEDANRLYVNIGNGFFTNRTAARLPLLAGIEETREVAFADVNNDGFTDVYFANVILFQAGRSAQDRLLMNNQGAFTDGTQERLPAFNTNTLDADFVDIDGDGDFDIVAGDFGLLDDQSGNYTGTNVPRMLINNGRGFFNDDSDRYFPVNFSPAVTDFEFADFNGDGLLDIFISNYNSPDVLLMRQTEQ